MMNLNLYATEKISNYFKKYFSIVLLLLLASCDDLPIGLPDDDTPPLEISQEIKELILFDGDEDAPIVVVNAASGPDSRLSMNDVNAITETFDTTDILTVNVHQGQTLNPSFIEENDITFEQAIDLNIQSIEMLSKVVTYFKGQGRTVYVFGLSFGAFIVQELISEKGIDVADSYLIMVGRLDINDEIWQALAEGRFGLFENGVTPIIFNETEPNVIDRKFMDKWMKLLVALLMLKLNFYKLGM